VASDLYCSRSDVARRLPPGALTSSAGLVASSLAASNAITYDGHGLETDDPVTVRVAGNGVLPVPLVEGVTYYARRLTNATLELAATVGGVAINLTSDGTSVIIARDPDFDGLIEFYSRWVDGFFLAHMVPFTAPIPAIVKGLVADLAAKRLLNISGQDSDAVNAAELAAKAQLERFATGIPTRDATATLPAANLAITSSLSATSDPRGWGSGTIP
jgi:hypothetical protein